MHCGVSCTDTPPPPSPSPSMWVCVCVSNNRGAMLWDGDLEEVRFCVSSEHSDKRTAALSYLLITHTSTKSPTWKQTSEGLWGPMTVKVSSPRDRPDIHFPFISTSEPNLSLKLIKHFIATFTAAWARTWAGGWGTRHLHLSFSYTLCVCLCRWSGRWVRKDPPPPASMTACLRNVMSWNRWSSVDNGGAVVLQAKPCNQPSSNQRCMRGCVLRMFFHYFCGPHFP